MERREAGTADRSRSACLSFPEILLWPQAETGHSRRNRCPPRDSAATRHRYPDRDEPGLRMQNSHRGEEKAILHFFAFPIMCIELFSSSWQMYSISSIPGRQRIVLNGRPRLQIRARIVDGYFIFQRQRIGASITFGQMQLIRCRMAGLIQPRQAVESGHVHHQRVAFIMTHGVAQPGGLQILGMRVSADRCSRSATNNCLPRRRTPLGCASESSETDKGRT